MAGFLAPAAPAAWQAVRTGATWAWRRLFGSAATTATQNPGTTAAVTGVAAATGVAMNGADDEIENTLSPADATTCTGLCARNNPCAHLADGPPGAQYRGGAHWRMTQPANDGLESHHTPANAASYLPTNMGPSIQMTPEDHALTASHPAQPGSATYRAQQAEMIAGNNFMGAQALDVANIRALFGDKYDAAILQMEAYTLCLRQNGLIR